MYILGISCSDKIVEVSLACDKKILSSFTDEKGGTENLILLIDKAVSGYLNSLSELSCIAITNGPGSYSGLRGGLATAKSLSQVFKIPIAPVSTLEAIAYNLIDALGTMIVAKQAKKDELNVAIFAIKNFKIVRLTEDFVIIKDHFFNFISKIKGEIYLVTEEGLIKNTGSNIVIADPCFSFPRASSVALIGYEKYKENKIFSYDSVLPRYSHAPNIREFKFN